MPPPPSRRTDRSRAGHRGSAPLRSLKPRRLAVLAAHTSPVDQPGAGDAGGLNVYVTETARRLAMRGVVVDVFTRADSVDRPSSAAVAPGVRVHHLAAGPRRPVAKEDLPALLCAYASEMLRHQERSGLRYDVVHSHYWLAGEAGALLADRWQVPHVHTPHTLARVKDAARAPGARGEPESRTVAEEHLVVAADRLVVNSVAERAAMVGMYGAAESSLTVVHPGVDLRLFRPGAMGPARERAGLPTRGRVMLFVGRLEPLKAPELVVAAAREVLRIQPSLRGNLTVVVAGGGSGATERVGHAYPRLQAGDGTGLSVRRLGPVPQGRLVDLYRAADVLLMPSRSESFGLVALEAQACGTPVVATAVGGLTAAVRHGTSGTLVRGPDPDAGTLARAAIPLLCDPRRRDLLSAGAVRHAAGFPWESTAEGLLGVYRDLLAEGRDGRPLRVPG